MKPYIIYAIFLNYRVFGLSGMAEVHDSGDGGLMVHSVLAEHLATQAASESSIL